MPLAAIRKPPLRALTSLRFFAALHVVAFHVTLRIAHLRPTAPWAWSLVSHGPTSVSLFFVLSGFVLTYNYFDDDDPRPLDRRRFWIARFARIYPLYALSLLILLPAHAVVFTFGPASIVESISCVALLQAWTPWTALRWNYAGWSLSVEAAFYLAFPFVAHRIARAPWRRMLLVMAAAWIASMALALGFEAIARSAGYEEGSAAQRLLLQVGEIDPLFRLPELVFGIALARWITGRLRAGAAPIPAALAVPAVATALAVLSFASRLPQVLVHNALLVPAFGLLIGALADASLRGKAPLSSAWLHRLGEASYALYVLHVPLLYWFMVIGFGGDARGVRLRHVVAFLIGAIVLSIAAFTWIEEPLRRRLRRLGAPSALAIPPEGA